MSEESKAFNLQHQVRNNARDVQDYMRELDHWENDSKKKDKSLSGSKSILKPTIPPVRNTSSISSKETAQTKQQQRKNEKKKKEEKSKVKPKDKISGYDYSAWDRLDVDSALKEMESSSESEVESHSDNSDRDDDDAYQEQKAEAARQMGNEHFKASKYREAIEQYSRSLQLNPNSELTLTNRALALIKTEKYAAAEQDCTSVLSVHPHNVKALYRRGITRYHLENYEMARVDFNTFLELEPSNQSAEDYIQKINVKISPELEGRFNPVDKPQHLMSKKPLVKVQIEEVGSGSGTESDDGDKIAKSNTEIMTEIFETTEQDKQLCEPKIDETIMSKPVSPSSPPRPISLPTVPTTNSTQFMNNWKTLKKEPELLYQYFHSLPVSLFPVLLVQFLENDGLPHLLRMFKDFYLQNGLTYFEELESISKVSRFNVAIMFMSKEDRSLCELLFRNIKNSEINIPALAKLYDISLS